MMAKATNTIKSIRIDECNLAVFCHKQDTIQVLPVTSGIEVIYADANIRILKMFDIGATPYAGRAVVRVDINCGEETN